MINTTKHHLFFFLLLSVILSSCAAQKNHEVINENFVTLENSELKLKINYLGAELISLVDKSNNFEYIWQGSSNSWLGSSPILFPIVGSLKDGQYYYENKSYKMPQHGFAKDKKFKLKFLDKRKASLVLKSDPSTFEMYPFDFELKVTFELVSKRLEVSYQVKNIEKDAMYFSIGGHPGFNLEMFQESIAKGYSIEFEHPENANVFVRNGKFLTGEKREYFSKESKIALTDNLFNNGALVFMDLKSDKVCLNKDGFNILEFEFEGFPYLALWSRPSNPGFVCIEPWSGLPDFESTNKVLSDKTGIIELEPNKTIKYTYRLRINKSNL